MVIDYEGQAYSLHVDEITVRQAITIFNRAGFTIAALEEALFMQDGFIGGLHYEALAVAFWVMKEQAGEHADISRTDYKLFPFMRAFGQSIAREAEIHEAAERIENDGLTDAEWVAALPPDSMVSRMETEARAKMHRDAKDFRQVWYTKPIGRLRAEYLWEFAKELGFSGQVIDDMRVSDFFSFCNCLKQYREYKKKKAEQKAKQNQNQF